MLSTLEHSQGIGGSELRKKLFETGDNNGDSSLSSDELSALFTAHLGASARMGNELTEKVLSKLDQDGDGQLTEAEFGLGQSARFSADVGKALLSQQEAEESSSTEKDLFTKADTNGDGVLSQDELMALFRKPEKTDEETLTKLFAKLDSDGDGEVSPDEIAPEKAEAPSADDAEATSGPFSNLDLNKDGQVSAEEWSKAAEKRASFNNTSTDLSVGKLDSQTLSFLLHNVDQMAA